MTVIRTMMPDDISVGMRLKEQAGWNQTVEDWQRFLRLQPDGGFIAEQAGVPVGTTMTIMLGSVAWVAMVLVEESVRGQGIGTALMQRAITFLDEKGVHTIRLDATPLGQPVYEKLGFVAQFTVARYIGTISSMSLPSNPTESVTEKTWDDVCQIDFSVTKTDRRSVLSELRSQHPDSFRLMRTDGKVSGYVTSRRGSQAVQIGPCLTLSGDAEPLIHWAASQHAGQRLYLDVPTENKAAVQCVERLGLRVQRHLLRMVRGEPVCEDVQQLWAGSGPEKG